MEKVQLGKLTLIKQEVKEYENNYGLGNDLTNEGIKAVYWFEQIVNNEVIKQSTEVMYELQDGTWAYTTRGFIQRNCTLTRALTVISWMESF